jgi:hypothetical protein
MFEPILPYIAESEKSIAQYPNIKPGEEFAGYTSAAKPKTGVH